MPHDPLAESVLDLAELVQAIGWEAALGLAPHFWCTDYEAECVRDGILWVMQQEGLRRQAVQRAQQQQGRT